MNDTPTTVSGDGVDLAVWETAAGGPTVVLVHGFPDTHVVWDLVAQRLAASCRVVAYDVRGSGQSERPHEVEAYRLDHLVADLTAVVDAVAPPDQPVHLVGHDWGSIQCWDALLRGPEWLRTGRTASFTSISGPSVDHLGRWVRRRVKGSWTQRRQVLGQARRSWYVFGFRLPWLPERVIDRADIARVLARAEHVEHWHAADTLRDDARYGLNLYRANAGRRTRVPGTTEVPVQLIVPSRDPFLSPVIYDDLSRYVRDLSRIDVDAGHWVVRTHAEQVAASISSFVHAHG